MINIPINNHSIIAVVSQFIPFIEVWKNLSNVILHIEISNSGFSVATPIAFVIEMLNNNN